MYFRSIVALALFMASIVATSAKDAELLGAKGAMRGEPSSIRGRKLVSGVGSISISQRKLSVAPVTHLSLTSWSSLLSHEFFWYFRWRYVDLQSINKYNGDESKESASHCYFTASLSYPFPLFIASSFLLMYKKNKKGGVSQRWILDITAMKQSKLCSEAHHSLTSLHYPLPHIPTSCLDIFLACTFTSNASKWRLWTRAS